MAWIKVTRPDLVYFDDLRFYSKYNFLDPDKFQKLSCCFLVASTARHLRILSKTTGATTTTTTTRSTKSTHPTLSLDTKQEWMVMMMMMMSFASAKRISISCLNIYVHLAALRAQTQTPLRMKSKSSLLGRSLLKMVQFILFSSSYSILQGRPLLVSVSKRRRTTRKRSKRATYPVLGGRQNIMGLLCAIPLQYVRFQRANHSGYGQLCHYQ